MGIKHSHTATGTNDGTKQVSVDRWNDDHTLDGGVTIPVEADPAAPAADTLFLYAKKIGGRAMLAQIGPSGRDTSFQPSLGGNKCGLWMPPGNGTLVPGVGMPALSATGTATSRTVETTNIVTRMTRIGYVSAGSSGSLAGGRDIHAKYTTGAGGGLGGFYLRFRFAPVDAATVAGARMFVGLWATTTAPTNVEPSSGLLNHVGVAQISTSSNLHIVASRGATPMTAIDLGADFPAGGNAVAYELALFSPPAGGVTYEVNRLNHAAKATGTIVAGDLPVGTTLLCLQAWRGNNATGLAVALDLCGIYVETEY